MGRWECRERSHCYALVTSSLYEVSVLSFLVKELIGFVSNYYGARTRFARDTKRLVEALYGCHAAWQALSNHPASAFLNDPEKLSALSESDRMLVTSFAESHRIAVEQLASAIKALDTVLAVFSPAARNALQGYASLEANVGYGIDYFDEYVHDLIRDSNPTEFEEAADSLNDYLRATFKPEELR